MRTFLDHWPEYASEAIGLGLFMVSAAGVTTLLRHPLSPLSVWSAPPLVQRLPMGLAMGLTLAAIVYSPLGKRSGAHMNPALTLTFLRLGKISGQDAAAYVLAQFAGGTIGILAATWLFAGLPADPSVNFVATVPGPQGAAVAFFAEGAISFGMMLLVLSVSNASRVMRWTCVCAGVLAHTAESLWIYFTAPLLGMLLAAEAYVRRFGGDRERCAKLHHPSNARCIFKCRFMESPA